MRQLVVALVFVAVTAAVQASSSAPPTVTPSGSVPIPLLSQATRAHLLGHVEVYAVALYGNRPLERGQLLSSDVAKALRIEVMYEDDPGRRLALDWRRELVPTLEPAAVTHLRGAFAALKRGDVIQVEYVPERGTTVRVNKAVVVSEVNHELMLAFLDHWIGQRPVSEDLKRSLLGS